MSNNQKETLISLENLERFKGNLENMFGKAEGIATLDINAKIPESQITEEAFNVFEYANKQAFPVTGKIRKIYIDKSNNNMYRWDATSGQYVNASSPDAVKYTSQELSEQEKSIARANIGAVSASEIPEGNNVQYVPQNLNNDQKIQARSNIGAASAAELPANYVKYSEAQNLTTEAKIQARTNIGAADASVISGMESDIFELQGDVLVLQDNVSDVSKTEQGLEIEYANGTSKTVELDTEFPIDSMNYDEEHFLHLLDKNGEDVVDAVYIAGGGGGTGAGSVKITRVTSESIDCVYGVSMPITFVVDARDGSDDPVAPKGSSWTVNGIVVARNIDVHNGQNTFDIGGYLSPGVNNIKIAVVADTGADVDVTGTKTWRINAVNMRFEWNYNDTRIITSDYTDTWVVYGDIEKTSHTMLGNTELPTTVTSKTGATQTLTIPMQEHGAYGVKRWLTATIGGTSQQTPAQYHEMIFAVPGETTPIIAISKENFSMNQYDTVQIPVVIYDPVHVQTNASLYIDNELITTWENVDRSVHNWSYTPSVYGQHTLAVVCGSTRKEIVVTVARVELDIEEVAGYTFKFKSSEFASNNAVRNWSSNGITATFSQNFDWVNGGLQVETDENGNLQQYVCVKAGTRMTINHKLFRTDPKADGMTFKMIYKVKNCRNYDATIGGCYNNVGIRLNAHNAVFNGSGTTLTIPYSEDDYIELEFDVYPQSEYRYIMAWMDGVITSCRVYDANETFVQPRDEEQNIVIGSDDCDVYVYMVKTYPVLVSRDGHINNFIMDAPNAAEMGRRYVRNNILGEDLEIDYQKLIANNPDCRVWLYDIPYLTNSKSNKVQINSFNQFWQNGDNYYQLSGTGKMSVQGTSSVNYIRGAANTDINFTALQDGNGNDLLAGGTKDDTWGNNWYTEDPDNPGHAKQYTVLDAKIVTGIRRKYTPAEARRIARVGQSDPLPANWVIYEEDANQQPLYYVNTNDTDEPGIELGPEWVVIQRDQNRNPVKYIHALGFKINDDSCPITYSNTKVNFASCEQVNNMCNAAWYQRFNPYPSLTARDCMEFEMGVQFIKDSGTVPDAEHFVLFGDDKYHMYSIANMGNSKKNVHVFHDLSNPNEVCVEVCDNDKNQMRMVNPDHLTRSEYFEQQDWTGKNEEKLQYYGMRYPDVDNPDPTVREAWYDLVWWMVTNNPNDHTDELLPEPETYEEYTFRGHDRPGTQVLRGTTITQYAGTYTHDTFERRMAKMLSECEDHMVMDSFIYHYLYLERHTMVDNVSKNNFWSCSEIGHTENGRKVERWDLSKAYDMDTSDGNNNQGQLVFDYGNEWNDDIGGMKVFNGGDSVWFVFCANLYEACRTMFLNRETAGAWSATAYHNFLLEQQHKVPERCWVQCYWYDYLRTYEQSISAEWMTFLDGGQKTHQRNHYEYFESMYDSSKYRGASSTSQNINFRAYTPNTYGGHVTNEQGAKLRRNAQPNSQILVTVPYDEIITIDYDNTQRANEGWYAASYDTYTGYISKNDVEAVDPKGQITVTMYNKMYISVDAGTTQLAAVKAERGVPTTIDFSSGGKLNNTLIIVNTASMIQAISGMEQLYPDTCVFANAVRLRELTIGSASKGYQNTFLRTLALGNNAMLERLYAQNLPNANSALDLSNCPALLTLDALGSGFTAYTFAKGGLLTYVRMCRPTSLSMINLSHLTDQNFIIEDISALGSLRFENIANVDSYNFVTTATALQTIRLIGIYWMMLNVNTLNFLLGLQGMDEHNITIDQSVVAGYVHTPSIRQRNLDEYAAAWPELEVDYNNVLEEFQITFQNPDGTDVLDRLGRKYIQYVDRGDYITDPVTAGYIDTPTMASTAQYNYSYTGWSNIGDQVMADRVVIATYSSSIRTYPVRWWQEEGVLLKSVEATYGSEVVYEDDNHTFPPVKTSEEQNLYFSVFLGWDNSTGYIKGETDVYAIWDREGLPTPGAKTLNNMSIAEIYGVAKTNRADQYFQDKDYTDITVGRDFDFKQENIESRVLLQERYFNGTEIVKFNDIKLFSADAPSFTLAVDYEFCRAGSGATLISCCDSTGSAEGFRVYYYLDESEALDQSVKVLWGDRTDTVAHGLNRGILVLRHRKGSKNLLVASDNGGRYVTRRNNYGGDDGEIKQYGAYNPTIHFVELPRIQETLTDSVLAFGAIAVGESGFNDAATGWIHWAKIWYEDLGTENVRQLASWPHETWRMQYRGHGLYNKADGTGLFDSASFIANAPLSQFYEMYNESAQDTTGGWRESKMRAFVNSRVFNALPYCWQSIIKPVRIVTKGGFDNPNNLEYTTDKIYIPSMADIQPVSTGLISSESSQVSWFWNPERRTKFMGITIPNLPEGSDFITDATDDPTLYDSYDVREGTVWVQVSNPAICYVYVSAQTMAKHAVIGGRPVANANNIVAAGAQGGLWVRAMAYWTRSNNATTAGGQWQYSVFPYGAVSTAWIYDQEYQRRGVVPMFSL